MAFLVTLNNKIVNKILVNFKFFNNKRNIFEEEENTKQEEDVLTMLETSSSTPLTTVGYTSIF